MNNHASLETGYPWPPDPNRVAALLARYPEVSCDEASEILIFLQAGRYIDVGGLTNDRQLGRKLDQFVKDHWVHFHDRPGKGEFVVVGFVILLFVLWVIWAVYS